MNANNTENNTANTATANTHNVILNGECIPCNSETLTDVCDGLIAKHGTREGLRVVPMLNQPTTLESVRKAVNVARAQSDLEIVQDLGFAPKATIYTRGMAVNDLGVENAKRSRLEFEARPVVGEAVADFVELIRNEHRRDVRFNLGDLRMSKTGKLVVGDARYQIERDVVFQLATRLGCGGGAYLADCWPELRAINVNHQAVALRESEKNSKEFESAVLRTRNGNQGFALVSPTYTPFDVDRIAQALRVAMPSDARCVVTYDGRKARFEVGFHTDIQPQDYVCGEFFKASIVVSTSDDGRNGISVSAHMFQNLCLNLICIDDASQNVANIRHVSSIGQLARKFSDALANSKSKIAPFIQRWGFACHENVMSNAETMSIHEFLPGLFNGLIERELVPVRGKRDVAIKGLVAAFEKDQSGATQHAGILSRASVVNAITRYAHETEQPDPWVEDELQKAAGKLLFSNAKMPYLSV